MTDTLMASCADMVPLFLEIAGNALRRGTTHVSFREVAPCSHNLAQRHKVFPCNIHKTKAGAERK